MKLPFTKRTPVLDKKDVNVLLVCMGNICRSPMAHGVLAKLLQDELLHDLVAVDSAGTHAYHVGEPPDSRAQLTAQRRGVDLSTLRARRVDVSDFEHFDYVLAMDRDNFDILMSLCPDEHVGKVRLFMEFAPDWREHEVPDPYYGGPAGFERVFDMVEAAARGLLEDIRRRHGL
ncbi:MAG: phosphotyrosine protein phosphatase [Gammaproteobacteria bacterium SG8_47]|nr:MAG: phosphotyrosine protein phosphatase [Gammaproteobacteria bacterium SG8_47]